MKTTHKNIAPTITPTLKTKQTLRDIAKLGHKSTEKYVPAPKHMTSFHPTIKPNKLRGH